MPESSVKKLRLKTFAMILFMILIASLGNLFLSVGMKQIGQVQDWSPSALAFFGFKIFSTAAIWLGIVFLLLNFISYLAVLSWADFSYVKPILALGYAFVTLLAYTVLKEYVSPMRVTGIALICLGVAAVGRTKVRTTKPMVVPVAEPVEEATSEIVT